MTEFSLGMFALPDLSGLVRGKSFGAGRTATALRNGLAWAPANILISPLSALPEGNPIGPMGEIMLRAVPSTAIRLPPWPGTPPMDLWLAEIFDRDGTPWACCPRQALTAAVALLKAETGVTLKLAFEHEFTLLGEPYGHDAAFSLAAIRRGGALAVEIDAALADADMEIEQIVPEFGAGQFEIASTPKDPLRACDEAVIAREVIRDAARRAGVHASFLPKLGPMVPGNGVHAHFSLWRGDQPVMAEDGWLTALGGAFAAGIIAEAPALMLLTTGSTNSFLRVRPSSWVGAYPCVGTMNREAMLRFCPRGTSGVLAKASLEFRAVDATANVYLAVAGLIYAGLQGLRANLATPVDVTGDPATLGRPDLKPLPATMEEALMAAEASDSVLHSLPPHLVQALLSVRRGDIARGAGVDPFDLADRLALIY